jgi:hypothetical protein
MGVAQQLHQDSPTRLTAPPRLTANTPETAAELARLLHPDLIEVRGCVLLPWAYEAANFEGWWERLNGDRARIEGVLNHLHLWDVFDAEIEDAKLREMAEIIAGSWQAAARAAFPERDFDIGVSLDGGDYGPTVYMHPASAAGVSGPPPRGESR